MGGINVQPRPSAVEQLARGTRSRDANELGEVAEAYEEARARSREAFMLDVKLTDGTIVSFDYAYMKKTKFLPDGKIILHFGDDEVTAEGRNLLSVYTSITEHRRRFIEEGTDAQAQLKGPDRPHIETIAIKEGVEQPLNLSGLGFRLLRDAGFRQE